MQPGFAALADARTDLGNTNVGIASSRRKWDPGACLDEVHVIAAAA